MNGTLIGNATRTSPIATSGFVCCIVIAVYDSTGYRILTYLNLRQTSSIDGVPRTVDDRLSNAGRPDLTPRTYRDVVSDVRSGGVVVVLPRRIGPTLFSRFIQYNYQYRSCVGVLHRRSAR